MSPSCQNWLSCLMLFSCNFFFKVKKTRKLHAVCAQTCGVGSYFLPFLGPPRASRGPNPVAPPPPQPPLSAMAPSGMWRRERGGRGQGTSVQGTAGQLEGPGGRSGAQGSSPTDYTHYLPTPCRSHGPAEALPVSPRQGSSLGRCLSCNTL